ncbi:TPA: HNH endonuclease [Klebsiella pneumoniae]|nr:HNH endonuclease [Klebsiella pneumoniae]
MEDTKINWEEIVEYKEGRLYWKIDTFSGRCYNLPAAVKGREVGARKNGGYWHFSYKNRHYLRHVVVWLLFNKEVPEGCIIDHIKSIKETGGISDDRIENLQAIDMSKNIRKGSGSIPNKTNKSSNRRGVSIDTKYKKKPWRARMRVENKMLCKNFETFEEAVIQREIWESIYC